MLKGGAGHDTLDGGANGDFADYRDKVNSVVVTLNGATDATVTVGGVAEDTIRNIENVYGGTAGDILTGDGFGNFLFGDAGNDLLKGGGGADTLDGSTGVDRADYADKANSVVVTLNGATNATVTVGGVAEDTIRNIENVTGGSAGDTLTGDGLANLLSGGAGTTPEGRARRRHAGRRRRWRLRRLPRQGELRGRHAERGDQRDGDGRRRRRGHHQEHRERLSAAPPATR